MAGIRFDHFITFACADNIDSYMERYKAAGFMVREQTVKHDPGLRNAFVSFGPEYIEFCWVEDMEQFEQGAETASFPRIQELQAACTPFAIGLEAEDLSALHDEWTRRGYKLPEVTQGIPRDAPEGTPPVWSFQAIPEETVGGAFLFALTYHTRKKGVPRKVSIAPNSTYAIAGVTFATDEPEKRATAWRDLLAPSADIHSEGGAHAEYSVQIGPHLASWLSPLDYQDKYGLSYKSPQHPFGEIAVLHLLAQDLTMAEEQIESLNRNATRMPDALTGVDTLLVPPDEQDGFTFAITERPAEEWLKERIKMTGESLEIG